MNLSKILKLVESGEINANEAHEIIRGELSCYKEALRNVNLDDLAMEMSTFIN